MSLPHDYAAQRQATKAAFAELAEANTLPDDADIDYQFIPQDGADWDGFEQALLNEGYGCTRFSAEAEGGPCLQATLHDQPLSALSIWMGEEGATRLALAHGFTPDGWGFLSDPE